MWWKINKVDARDAEHAQEFIDECNSAIDHDIKLGNKVVLGLTFVAGVLIAGINMVSEHVGMCKGLKASTDILQKMEDSLKENENEEQ